MQFEYTDEQTELEKLLGGFRHLNAFGPIVRGDADRLLKLIEAVNVPPSTTVYINSPGGDAEEGIKLGCVIRAYQLETAIGSYVLEPNNGDALLVPRTLTAGVCMSAATLMYAGGRLRHFTRGSKFGVHRFAYKNPVPENVEKSQELSAGIAEFLDKMGVPLSFLSLSAGVASDTILELNEDQLREHGMVTGGVTDVVWGTEMRSNMLYVRGTRDSIFGRHKVALAHTKDAGFMFFAVIEAQGRQSELCDFGVVEIVVNGEDHRIDVSQKCSRIPNDVDVIFLAKLTDEEARLLAYSESFGVQVRTSKEAEVFLGASALETEGGQDSLRSLYESMRGD